MMHNVKANQRVHIVQVEIAFSARLVIFFMNRMYGSDSRGGQL